MGVIIKYQLIFKEADRSVLTVSNDLFKGDFIIDADITAEMMRGAVGGKFNITLYDLPLQKVKDLNKSLGKLNVVINLGYFDGSFETVMEGVVKKIRSSAEGDKLITSIHGFESGTHALLNTKYNDFKEIQPGVSSILAVVEKLLKKVKADEGKQIDLTPTLSIPKELELKDKMPRGENLLEVLDDLAKQANKAELLVCDKKVWMGHRIINDTYKPPPMLQRDTNLAIFRPFTKKTPAEASPNMLDETLKAAEATGFEFTITGDPKLRPAHKVVADIDDYGELSGEEFRVYSLVHQLTVSGGYVCKGVAIKVCRGSICSSPESPNAETIAQNLRKKFQAESRRRPLIEIGQIKAYNCGEASTPEKHLSTLYFNQRFEETETQPSLRAEVDVDERQLFPNKPLVSPFAWHKCGLMVPVYPGMKALLTHNLNLQDDALVTGFIWSEKPAIEPPKNKEGDWWLCLPIDFNTANPPSDSTKAANDLTANNGKRVIEVKGLKITVGNEKLKNVGERPSEGEDDEFLIEHKNAKIKIAADGSIEMTADTNGGVKLKLSKSSVEVS